MGHSTAQRRRTLFFNREQAVILVRQALGVLLAANFVVFWLAPVLIQGQVYRRFLNRFVRPIHDALDQSGKAHAFAIKYIYRERIRADYFATAIFFLAGFVISLSVVVWWQLANGSVPWWLVIVYYFLWVGIGGRAMAAAYTFAHREGHAGSEGLYQPWLQRRIGNFFENRIGLFYGNVPHLFSTSHVLLHHRLNAGKGDPFYMWDIDRTKFGDLMLYNWRTFVYMTGWSSLVAFRTQRNIPVMDKAFHQLRRGMVLYWLTMPALSLGFLLATGSEVASAITFLVLFYFQPLSAMSSFLMILNIAFHGFIEFEENGKPVRCVCSTAIIDGSDDAFGENDHMAHHDFGGITHDRLAAQQRSQHNLWAKRRASVFRDLSAFELSIFIVFGKFRTLAEKYYVDFAGDMSVDETAALLETRARRKEMDYAEYEFNYLPALAHTTEELVLDGTCKNLNLAYIYQSGRKMPLRDRALRQNRSRRANQRGIK